MLENHYFNQLLILALVEIFFIPLVFNRCTRLIHTDSVVKMHMSCSIELAWVRSFKTLRNCQTMQSNSTNNLCCKTNVSIRILQNYKCTYQFFSMCEILRLLWPIFYAWFVQVFCIICSFKRIKLWPIALQTTWIVNTWMIEWYSSIISA